MGKIGWVHAWQEALYGPRGFYRGQVPARDFATATHPPLGAVLAEAIWHYADLLELSGVVDIGAGRGELIGALHAHRPDRPLLGVDVVERPADLPDGVGWLRGPGGAPLPDELSDLTDVLVVAHEWLDVVPCVIGQLDADGVVREVLVDPTSGDEDLGDPLADVKLPAAARLAGDGFSDYGKPFRTLEDLYVGAAVLAWLLRDPRFATHEARLANIDALDDLIQAHVGQLSLDEALLFFAERDITAGPVCDVADLMQHPYVVDRGLLVQQPTPDGRSVPVHAPPYRIDGRRPPIRRPAPTLGQHNTTVLRDLLGYDEAAIAALTASGVLRQKAL